MSHFHQFSFVLNPSLTCKQHLIAWFVLGVLSLEVLVPESHQELKPVQQFFAEHFAETIFRSLLRAERLSLSGNASKYVSKRLLSGIVWVDASRL